MQPQSVNTNTDYAQTPLEQMILDTKAGRVKLEAFFHYLLGSELFVTSQTEIQKDGSGFAPLLYDRDGVPMTAVFTSFARASSKYEIAKYALQIKGQDIFTRIPSGYGIVVNPGFQIGMEILPHGVKQIIQELKP